MIYLNQLEVMLFAKYSRNDLRPETANDVAGNNSTLSNRPAK